MVANVTYHGEKEGDRSSMKIFHRESGESGRSCGVGRPAQRPGVPWIVLTALLLSSMFTVSAYGTLSLPVAFVGNTVVDLGWPKTPVCNSYRVFRDGALIAEIAYGSDPWYRDGSVTQGSSVTYEVRYMSAGRTDPVYTVASTITVGEVEGRIYQNLVWETGTYTIHGPVYIHVGATLNIGKVTVEPWSENYSRSIEAAGNTTSNYAHPGGRISAHEAWIEGLTLTFSSESGNSVTDSNLTGGGTAYCLTGSSA
jgi:hypothetical protein